ncbi:Transport and Golgi organization protein 2 [Orchesella cincta]|uniref:Transport and Golgi organization protein 2 n=1 Tax=Orchesella cincta TaxID=48709 RepID=A0A1D2MRR7_ORCCI|nr:Transport and Golgi organization protein 2 [Orchesella cincta]
MCILFLYVANNPSPDSYKVVLAVNRDEVYKRPTQVASFWGTSPDVLGGRDMQSGREGGTWLAVSESGRIGALLNVLQSAESLSNASQRRGRGFLVNDFLLNPSVDAVQYIATFRHVYGIGNSFIDIPFQKVIHGKEAFTRVVSDNNSLDKKESLINGILEILKNQEKFHPDPQMYKQAADQPETFLHGISSRFIKLPGYGTRTHTIILVDFSNNVFYQEITLKEPINEIDQEWMSSSFEFKINENNNSH